MSEIIDNKFPAPVQSKATWRADLNQLEIGQSFSFDNDKRSSVAHQVSVHFHKLTNKRFTVSADPEYPATKSRVWRIEDFKEAE